MNGEVGIYSCGRGRGKHRKRLGPHCNRHHGRDDEGIGTGVGQQKDGIESAGGGRT